MESLEGTTSINKGAELDIVGGVGVMGGGGVGVEGEEGSIGGAWVALLFLLLLFALVVLPLPPFETKMVSPPPGAGRKRGVAFEFSLLTERGINPPRVPRPFMAQT